MPAAQLLRPALPGAALTLVALLLTATLTAVGPSVALVAAVVSIPVALVLVLARSTEPGRSRGSLAAELVLYLAPVGLLMIAFPWAAQRVHVSIGGTPLVALLLASSVTVPWLSQCVCLPLYRAIGDLLPVRDSSPETRDAVARRLVAVWPSTLVQTAPVVLLFAAVLGIGLRWSAAALAVYVGLALLHLVFAQAVVLGNVTRQRGTWALSWLGYALALVTVPTWWALPPLVATAVQLWPMRRALKGAARGPWERLPLRTALADVGRGLLTGSILWADKFLLFVVTAGRFEVDVVYVSMLPVVLAYNVYFVLLAPGFDDRVIRVRHALEHGSFEELDSVSRDLVSGTASALARTGLVAAVLSVGVCAAVVAVRPGAAVLTVLVALASWAFMAVTLLAYKLDYVGRRDLAMVLGGAHLVLTAAALLALPVVPAYLALLVGELVLAAVAAALAFRVWSAPSYALFWRHATSW